MILKDLKISERDVNILWSCISYFSTKIDNIDIYYNIYNKLCFELGLSDLQKLEGYDVEDLSISEIFSVFKDSFYKNELEVKLSILQIFFDITVRSILSIVYSSIKERYNLIDIENLSKKLTFEDLKKSEDNNFYMYNTSFYSFVYLENCIDDVNKKVLKINEVLDNNNIKLVLKNKIEIKKLDGRVYDFCKGIENISEDDAVVIFVEKTNDFIFNNIVDKCIKLTENLNFKTANEEFLRALDSYKNSNYIDSVNGACASLESTIKIICEEKKYPFKKNRAIK